jgi:hypothetical protein
VRSESQEELKNKKAACFIENLLPFIHSEQKLLFLHLVSKFAFFQTKE